MANTPKTDTLSDDLTVLVFKDNYAARTFHIPLAWISRFGFFIGLLAAATLLSTFLAIKYYRSAIKTDPGHVQDLEQELGDLRNSYKSLELKAASTALPITAVAPVAPTIANTAPIPTVTVTITAAPVAVAPKAAPVVAPPPSAALTGPIFLFRAFPASIVAPTAESVTSSPIKLQGVKINYRSHSLYVNFNLQYVGASGSNQQGRIIILARGTDRVMAYPAGSLNLSGKDTLISPEQGEYFSVSRIRVVKADFGPLYSPATIKEIEVLLLGQTGQVLLYQKLNVPGSQVSTPKQAPKEEPAEDTSTETATDAKPTVAKPAAPVVAPTVNAGPTTTAAPATIPPPAATAPAPPKAEQ